MIEAGIMLYYCLSNLNNLFSHPQYCTGDGCLQPLDNHERYSGSRFQCMGEPKQTHIFCERCARDDPCPKCKKNVIPHKRDESPERWYR